jgi:hypothetical protein
VKCGARVALGVAGGYLLGRTKKMKLALMLGGMAAGRRAGGPGELLNRGTKLVEASPELSRLVGEVRGRLLEAGKGAVVAVATRQVEALTDRVGKRVESLAGVGVPKQRGKADEEPTDRRGADEAQYERDDDRDDYGRDDYERDEYDRDEPQQDETAQDARPGAERDEEPAEERAAAPPRRTRTPAAKATGSRSGRGASASAAVKRTATGTGRGTGRKPARTTRTRRSDGDG